LTTYIPMTAERTTLLHDAGMAGHGRDRRKGDGKNGNINLWNRKQFKAVDVSSWKSLQLIDECIIQSASSTQTAASSLITYYTATAQ